MQIPLTDQQKFFESLERQKCRCKPGVADYHKNNEWDEDGWDCKIIPANEIDPKEVVYIQKEPLRKVFIDFLLESLE